MSSSLSPEFVNTKPRDSGACPMACRRNIYPTATGRLCTRFTTPINRSNYPLLWAIVARYRASVSVHGCTRIGGRAHARLAVLRCWWRPYLAVLLGRGVRAGSGVGRCWVQERRKDCLLGGDGRRGEEGTGKKCVDRCLCGGMGGERERVCVCVRVCARDVARARPVRSANGLGIS